MKNLKQCIIIGIIFVLAVGTLSHFVYELSGNNVLIGLITPVNESIWEHMKLVFFPMLLYSFYAIKKMKYTYPCITSSFCMGILVGTFLIPILFYTYSGILGYTVLIIDLLIFVLSVLIAFGVVYKTTPTCNFVSYEETLKTIVFLLAIAFFWFTYFPPDIALFKSPS